MPKERLAMSRDPARQDTSGVRMLYVLGFGLAGAVMAEVLIFVYFERFF